MTFNPFIAFSIAGCVNIILLILIYFSKKRIELTENKVYIGMIFTSLIGIFFEVIMTFFLAFLNNYNLSELVAKAFLYDIEFWAFLLCTYTMLVSNYQNKVKGKYIRFKLILLLIWLLVLYFFTCFLELKYAYNEAGTTLLYTYGPATKIVFVAGMSFVTISIISILVNKAGLKNKKFMPVYAYVFLTFAVSILQQFLPEALMISYTESVILLLMYFTIENPDLQLINELNIAKAEADRANEAKSEFLANMSHEIRTPLNAITGFSEALAEEEGMPESAKDDIKDIIMASQTLLEIVNGILDISKIEANKIEIIDSVYKPQDIFDELLSLTKIRIGDKPIEIRTFIDQNIPKYLYGDHTRLKQVVLNFLTNAAKYTDSGHIDFKVSGSIDNNICHLIISVIDTGRGIRKEKMSALFTKFDRLDEENNTTIEGTGLGLAITKKLVDLMHGKIVVESNIGEGSNFTVYIDQKLPNPEDIPKEETRLTNINVNNVEVLSFERQDKKKVLVVDDNNLNLKVATKLISKLNLEVITASSGQECINKILNGEKYDIILLDDMMPELSGKDTLLKLRKIEGFNIPVIALTANALSGMREEYIEFGFNDYLAKPIEIKELEKIINKYLGI